MFHGTISNPKPFLIQHVAFILLSKITPCGIIIYKLSLFSTLIHGEMKEEGAWWVRGKGGGGREREVSQKGCRFLLLSSCIHMSWFTNHRRQGKGEVTLGQ